MNFNSITDLFEYAKRDKYLVSDEAWVEDRTYHIGEISQKTGLRKCFVNGNIVWLLPNQSHDYLQNAQPTKKESHQPGRCGKKARSESPLKKTGDIRKDANNYLTYIKNSWNARPVYARYLNNARVRLNRKSFTHLFESHGQPRPLSEVEERAECLPYVRDILERSGKPFEHRKTNTEESYSIVGNAIVNNQPRDIKVVISRDIKKGRYFYLSVFKIN